MAHERPRFYQSPNNGLPPPERGGGRHGIIAPTRPDRTRAPTRDAPPPPKPPLAQVLEEAIFEESRRTAEIPKKPNKTIALIFRGILTGLAFTAIGVGENKDLSDDEPTPQTRSVGSFPNSFNSKEEGPVLVETKKVNPNETYYNDAKRSKINKNNTHLIDLQQTDQLSLKPVISKDAQTIKSILPFKIPENTTGTIERIDLAETDPNAQDPTQRPPVTPIQFQFDQIVTIVAPGDSHVYVVRGVEKFGQNPNFAGSVRIYKYYEEQDTTVLWLLFDNHPTEKGYLVPLLPMQDFDKNIGRGTNYEKLPVVDILTEIATTSAPNRPINLTLIAYKGKIAGPEAEVAGNDFLLKPHFFTNSSNGTEKLLALRKE